MSKTDILNRTKFLDQLVSLVENISENHASVCFAIDGTWGCGKSFVLDMLEEQLKLIPAKESVKKKYFVIRYNCWKFDYYPEPLIAIVAAIMDVIEKETALFPDSQEKKELLGMFKAAGYSLLSIGTDAVKAKTGLDFQTALETLRKGKCEGAAAYENDHSFDVYFSFNKVLNKLSEILQDLAKQYTIVFLVDELDRCLPQYAIKVLERLHHLLEGESNIVTILALDKSQLSLSIQYTFGFNDSERYLAKFINFDIKLDIGESSKKICEKYADYIALFDKEYFTFNDSIEEFMQAIFKGIDIRTQEQLVKKATIAHNLIYNEKKDYSFMCMELLLAVLICIYKDESCFIDSEIPLDSFPEIFTATSAKVSPAFSSFFEKKFSAIDFICQPGFPGYPTAYILPRTPSLYAAILFTWIHMHKIDSNIAIQHPGGEYTAIAGNYKELRKYTEVIRMIS